MTKLMMLIIAAVALAAILLAPPRAQAVDLPVREVTGITNTTASVLDMPATQGNGQLQRVQVVDDKLTNNTCVLKHVLSIPGSGRKVTNTVATVTYTTTPGASLVITNGPYLIAGDSLLYQFGTASTGLVFSARTLAK